MGTMTSEAAAEARERIVSALAALDDIEVARPVLRYAPLDDAAAAVRRPEIWLLRYPPDNSLLAFDSYEAARAARERVLRAVGYHGEDIERWLAERPRYVGCRIERVYWGDE